MALAGGIGASWSIADIQASYASVAFGENQGRFVVTTADYEQLKALADERGISCEGIGKTGGSTIACYCQGTGHPARPVDLADLRTAHDGFFPKLMGSELTPEF